METFIHVKYDPDSAEVACEFADAFASLPVAVQLDVAKDAAQRLADLASSLEAIIARSSSSNP
jgi:hypothetical protein